MTVWPRVQDIALVKELGLPRIGGCILIDGAIGARTAALTRPYDDDPSNTGVLYFTQDDFTRFAGKCAAAGLQLCVHAIGDAAIEQGLVAYEALAAKYDLHALRPRIDHWCLATPAQCGRASKLGVASGMQPAFDYFWGGAQGAYYRALTGRALAANALKTALDAGMILGGGSDAPITPLDPRLGIHAACHHTNERERLSFGEAVRLFTVGSAALGKHESEVGSFAEGFAADFTAFAGDTGAENIHGREALLTVHRGKVVWDAALGG
jgi:predicted amidohydrolase YtcJ